MRNTVKTLCLSALVGALAFGGAAIARGPGGGFGPHGDGAPIKQLLKKLDLDDEQKALAKQIHEENFEVHETLAAQKAEGFELILGELEKEEPNRRVIHNSIDEGLELAGEALHNRVDAMLGLHATFSAEQREILVEELGEMQELRERMMEEHRDRFESNE